MVHGIRQVMAGANVGIFFLVDGEVLMDSVSLDKGESYGDAVQHGSHYEFWKSLIPKNKIERKFKMRAYDAYPRGRVIYSFKELTFWLYSDRCLRRDDIDKVTEKFGLKKIKLKRDEHYQCAKCNPLFMD